jgi:hypothetical protein
MSAISNLRPLSLKESGLLKHEWQVLKRLNTPEKIQDFLNALPFNFEKRKETYMSVGRTLKRGKAHCFEGALVAAAALWINGHKPLLLDLNTRKKDIDHVIVLFRKYGHWGALSKTNHAVLRYREPVYRSIRELVMSYFHEYFLPDGKKTLVSYSKPFDLSKVSYNWLTGREELFDLVEELDGSEHLDILPKSHKLRKADGVEIKAGRITEWKK